MAAIMSVASEELLAESVKKKPKKRKNKKPRGHIAASTAGSCELVSKAEAARRLGYHPASLDRLLRDEKIKLTKIYLHPGALPRFNANEIEKLKIERSGGAA